MSREAVGQHIITQSRSESLEKPSVGAEVTAFPSEVLLRAFNTEVLFLKGYPGTVTEVRGLNILEDECKNILLPEREGHQRLSCKNDSSVWSFEKRG